ncbi:MAG: hypothetical protein EOO39_41875, partial [Cytophagaceae bacterium]
MKNQYLLFSILLTGIYARPQPAVAQLLTRAQPAVEHTMGPHQSPPEASASQRNRRSRSLKKALTELERRFTISVAYDEQLLAGRQTELDLDG